jgi:hypothetical protein
MATGARTRVFIAKAPVSSEGEPPLSSDTDMALSEAQSLLFSAKNLLEQDRMTLGGEASLTA